MYAIDICMKQIYDDIVTSSRKLKLELYIYIVLVMYRSKLFD